MIKAVNISKTFNDKQILFDVNAEFQSGKVNLVIGSSGSGKTVFLKCLVGLFEVDKGEIFFDDRNFTTMKFEERKHIRKDIGMLFQGSALFDSQTVEENIMFPLNVFTKMSLSEKQDRANFCLNRVNLTNINNRYPSEISGGMQKRVAIARAIAMSPKYLFCDEPNSGLDPKTGILIDNLIKEITEEYNIVTIINTHDMNSVMEIGENIYYIHEGRVWWNGNKLEILNSDNKELNDFVFATHLVRQVKNLNKQV